MSYKETGTITLKNCSTESLIHIIYLYYVSRLQKKKNPKMESISRHEFGRIYEISYLRLHVFIIDSSL